MSSVLVDDIGELVTNDRGGEGGPLGIRRDVALLVEDGRVAWIGPARDAPADRKSVV